MRAFSQVTWPSPGRERTSTLAPTKATLQLGAQEWSRSERPRDRAVPIELPIPSVSSVELISSLKTQHLKRIVRKKFLEDLQSSTPAEVDPEVGLAVLIPHTGRDHRKVSQECFPALYTLFNVLFVRRQVRKASASTIRQ